MFPRLAGYLAAAALAALFAAPAWPQDLRILPVPPHIRPQWTPMPGNPQVNYAPNLPTSVFRYKGNHYFFFEDYWYTSKSVKGPWRAATQVPPAIASIDPAYFKKPLKAPATARPPAMPPGMPPGVGGITPPPAEPPAPPAIPPLPPEEAPPPPVAPGERLPPPRAM